ncbi:hypothetical protein Q7C36_020357 [Tachysurus vachellii]|uniref:Uncharacterized protein n=1 Tax=Tachysurus vachellii TaxID=175792 RepID=A0AA88RZH9_TACVA|nr:hypothetical protein Q7C36_020357 [Tachysurus vachellii]
MRLASRIIRMARVFPSLQTGAVARSSHRRFRGAIRAPPQNEHVEDIRKGFPPPRDCFSSSPAARSEQPQMQMRLRELCQAESECPLLANC